MANIINQRLEIAGHPDDLKEVMTSMAGEEHKVSLEAIHPTPQDLLDVCRKYKQYSSVVNWRKEYWGCNHDVQECDPEWKAIRMEESWLSMECVRQAIQPIPAQSLEAVRQIRFWTYSRVIDTPIRSLTRTFPEVVFCLCGVDEFKDCGSVDIWFNEGLLVTDEFCPLDRENDLHVKLVERVCGEWKEQGESCKNLT